MMRKKINIVSSEMFSQKIKDLGSECVFVDLGQGGVTCRGIQEINDNGYEFSIPSFAAVELILDLLEKLNEIESFLIR